MAALMNKELGISIANSFRLGHEAEAHDKLTQLIDNLSTLTEKDMQERPELPAIFSEMLQAQQQRDLLHLADIIQYKLFSP